MAADVQACLAFMVRFALFIVCKAKKHLYFYINICTGRRFCVSNATRPAYHTLVVRRGTTPMKKAFYIFNFILLTNLIFAQTSTPQQNPNPKRDKNDWTDTTFILVNLTSTIKDKKIVAVDIGKKTTIYISKKLLRQNAVKSTSDYNKADISKIIHFIDSTSAKTDTIFIDPYLAHLDYLISDELQNGNAKVFYKKQKSFVPTISHRLEKYGKYAHRFFYLPDKRPFYSTMEMSGILDEKNPFALSDPKELEQLATKLADLNK
jgi:hypothetical protein